MSAAFFSTWIVCCRATSLYCHRSISWTASVESFCQCVCLCVCGRERERELEHLGKMCQMGGQRATAGIRRFSGQSKE